MKLGVGAGNKRIKRSIIAIAFCIVTMLFVLKLWSIDEKSSGSNIETKNKVEAAGLEKAVLKEKYVKTFSIGENLSFMVDKLDGMHINPGESVFANSFVGEKDLDDITSPVARASITMTLMECMGKDTKTFEEYHMGPDGYCLLNYDDNYNFCNGMPFEFDFVYIKKTENPVKFVFGVKSRMVKEEN